MAIEFRCHQCSKLLRVDESSAGKKARCPECGNIQDVPLQSTAATVPPATYGGSAPPGAVPMSAPSHSPPPSYSPPAHSSPPYGGSSPGNPFGATPMGTTNPYADHAPNPYSAPQYGYSYPPLDPAFVAAQARGKVRPPAIVMIVGGVLMLLCAAAIFLLGFAVLADGDDEPAGVLFVFGIIGVLCSLVPIVAGALMYSMRVYGLCMAAAIITTVLGFLICLPAVAIGIWAVVVLADSQVKAQFR
jgi:phage FluMu protein Com